MPFFAVWCDIEAENISHFHPVKPEQRVWDLFVKCTRCEEQHPNAVSVDPTAADEQDGGTANMHMRCRGCKHSLSISVVQPSARDAAARVVTPGKSAVVAVFDCRGCDIVRVSPDGMWAAENQEHGKQWPVRWVTGEEFAEYEEDVGGLATISKIDLSVRRA